MSRTLLSVLCSILFLVAGSASAESVAINFMADSWDGGPYPLTTGETAGVVPQGYWNNAAVVPQGTKADIIGPTAGMLVNDVGQPTPINVLWYADKDAGSDGNVVTPDERLMKGFLEGYWRDPPDYSVRVVVDEVPYASYTVIAYLCGFGFDTTASARIGDQEFFYIQSSDFTTDGYQQATATSLAYASLASYAVFEGITGDGFALDIFRQDGNRGALAGLQIISTADGLTGDYNGNGMVDAADYTLWRDTLGSVTDLRADGDRDGHVDPDDFWFWKTHFGESFGVGRGLTTSTSVPEPSTGLLALAALGCFLACGARTPRRYGPTMSNAQNA